MHEEFRGDGLVVLALSNEPLAKVQPYAERYGLPFAVGAGSGTGQALGRMVGARGIPHSYLIDPKGNLAWHGHPSRVTNKTIQAALRGATKVGEKGVLAWHGEVEGAPEAALTLAAEGELSKALRALAADESAGASALREQLEEHVALLGRQVEAGFARRDVARSFEVLELLVDETRGLPVGEPLAARLKEVRKDDALQAELDAGTALERALELGRKRGMKKARKSLERIVEKYPGTRAAERANQLIREL